MSAAGASPSSSPESGSEDVVDSEGSEGSEGFEELTRALAARQREMRLQTVALRSVDSTNRLARRLAARIGDELPRLLLVAWGQSAGRGRVGRSWSSPPGLGAYQSIVCRVGDEARLALLPLRVGIGLCRTLGALVPQLALKWPNDLVTPRGKLGGILIELLGGRNGTLIVGYGINVGHDAPQLPLPTATSIRLERQGDLPVPLGELICRMASAVVDELDADEPPACTLDRYRELAAHRPGDRLGCTLAGQRYEGRFVDFDEQGRLVLDTAAGRRALSAADVVETPAPSAEAEG